MKTKFLILASPYKLYMPLLSAQVLNTEVKPWVWVKWGRVPIIVSSSEWWWWWWWWWCVLSDLSFSSNQEQGLVWIYTSRQRTVLFLTTGCGSLNAMVYYTIIHPKIILSYTLLKNRYIHHDDESNKWTLDTIIITHCQR